MKSNESELINDLDLSNFEMVLKYEKDFKGIETKTLPESDRKVNSKNKSLYPKNKDWTHLEITNFKLNDDVKGFNVFRKRNELGERWRHTQAYLNSVSPWGIVGYTNTYTETDGACSLDFEVWTGKRDFLNPFPLKFDYRIIRSQVFTNNSVFSMNFSTADRGKDGYIMRWDEDGFLCNSSEVFINGQVPHVGWFWLRG